MYLLVSNAPENVEHTISKALIKTGKETAKGNLMSIPFYQKPQV
jgi:hypothetical protein